MNSSLNRKRKNSDSPSSQEFTNWCKKILHVKDKSEHCYKKSLWSMTYICMDFSFKFPIKGSGRFVLYSKLTHHRSKKEAGSIAWMTCPYQSSQKRIKPSVSSLFKSWLDVVVGLKFISKQRLKAGRQRMLCPAILTPDCRDSFYSVFVRWWPAGTFCLPSHSPLSLFK